MLLTIDAGNTRTKWAIFNRNGEITHQDACLNEAVTMADLSPQSLGYERVMISNVAGKEHAAVLTKKIAPYNLPVRWISASQQACDVFNSYHEPETLGTDRWAAVIAAWHMEHAPCVIVNAGTAVTIDAVAPQIASRQQGEFLGGLILPGLDLMQKSLGLATAQLPKNGGLQNKNEPDLAGIFARNTIQAIHAGALNAILGAIVRMIDTLERRYEQKPHLILSGGNALIVQNNLAGAVTNQVIIVDNLVLQGLYLLDRSTLLNSN